MTAVKFFPTGSASEFDGIRSLQIQDLINNKKAGPALLTLLVTFVKILLAGHCFTTILLIYFSGSLITLGKKEGG